VSLRRSLLFAAVGALGASAVVLPAIATSETPTISAYSYLGKNYWSPPSASTGAGSAVNLSNTTGVPHGVEWREGPETPSCSSGVPVGAGNFGKEWKGSCTFAKAGTYIFWCTVHHSEMTGTVTVNAAGATTATTTTTTQPTTSSGPVATTPSGSGGPGSGSTLGAPPGPLAGTALTAIKLPSRQRGRAVHGSVEVSPVGAGGRLEVELLAARASLASASRPRTVPVGRFVRAALAPGTARFSVVLGARARRALVRHRRLALSVRIVVRPLSGAAVTVLRSVLLKP
jgi:plastocyanin